MGESKGDLSCKEPGLVFWEHAHFDQMAEKFATFDKLHEEVDTELVLEDVLHIDKEGMIYRPQDILLQLNVLHLLILQNYILPDALHRIQFLSLRVLDEEHFTESTLANHFADLEIFELGRLRLVSGENCSCSSCH